MSRRLKNFLKLPQQLKFIMSMPKSTTQIKEKCVRIGIEKENSSSLVCRQWVIRDNLRFRVDS